MDYKKLNNSSSDGWHNYQPMKGKRHSRSLSADLSEAEAKAAAGRPAKHHEGIPPFYADVQNTFLDNPEKFKEFIKTMKEFKLQKISAGQVASRIEVLFHGHKHLIIGFNKFLPKQLRIRVEKETEEERRMRKERELRFKTEYEIHQKRMAKEASTGVSPRVGYKNSPQPRSPRNQYGRPTRGAAQEHLKKRNDAATERVFVRISTEKGEDVARRRYVDQESETPSNNKPSGHRRAVSLSMGSAEEKAQVAAVGEMLQVEKRNKQKKGPQTMRLPAKPGSLRGNLQLGAGTSPLQSPRIQKVKNEASGHHRTNSWDKPNGLGLDSSEDDDASYDDSSDNSKVIAHDMLIGHVLATKKAELAEKERLLLEKYSRQEAELKSLNRMNMDREMEELLLLQRRLKEGREEELQFNVSNTKIDLNPHMYVQDDESESDLSSTLDGLNMELEELKERTRKIESRVLELRCPGPTPLEMMTGGSISNNKKGTLRDFSSKDDPFGPRLPNNVRRVEARRSPVPSESSKGHPNGLDRSKSPDQSLSAPFLSKQSSFNSAFSPTNVKSE